VTTLLIEPVARLIESFSRLPGIGPQKAKNIVAQLQNKVAKFALQEPAAPPEGRAPAPPRPVDDEGLRGMVFEVLVKQLGHRPSEASELIAPAVVASPDAGARFQFTIPVDDVDAVCADLRGRGVELLNGPMDRPWGIRTAAFRDPAGYIWEIAN